MTIFDRKDVLKSQAELVRLGGLEVLIFEEFLQFYFLLRLEVAVILKPEAAGLFEVGPSVYFHLAHGVHGLVDELHEVKAIEGDLGMGKMVFGPFLESGGQIHTDVRDDLCTVRVGFQVRGEPFKGGGILARGCKQ